MVTFGLRSPTARLHTALLATTLLLLVSGCAVSALERVTGTTTPPINEDGRLDADDGFLADGELLSPFATSHPAIANLDDALLRALQSAATDAEADGVKMMVSAGWRSAAYQKALFEQARVKYGSLEEASRWVDSVDESKHVSGEAVDILPTSADSWLSQHGSDYGLCQTFANEIWHFELATTPGGRCPRMARDASQD